MKHQVSTSSISLSVRQQKLRLLQRRRQQLSSSKWHRQELNDTENNDQTSETTDHMKKLTIRQLIHACQCDDIYCRFEKCQMMKRVVQHIKTCKRRTTGGCAVCKKVVALCCHHSRHCQDDDNCSVPFCYAVKQKLQSRRCNTIIQVNTEF